MNTVRANFMDPQTGEGYVMIVDWDAPPQPGETFESAERRWRAVVDQLQNARDAIERAVVHLHWHHGRECLRCPELIRDLKEKGGVSDVRLIPHRETGKR